MPTPNSWLDGIRIAAPCHADWATMTGDERSRMCAACDRRVWNLSDMTRSDAEALVSGATGRTCVRFWRRADGTVLTSDCPVGVGARRRRVAALAAMLVAGFGTLAAAASGLLGRPRPQPVELPRTVQRILEFIGVEPGPQPLMGSVAYPGPMPEPEPEPTPEPDADADEPAEKPSQA